MPFVGMCIVSLVMHVDTSQMTIIFEICCARCVWQRTLHPRSDRFFTNPREKIRHSACTSASETQESVTYCDDTKSEQHSMENPENS